MIIGAACLKSTSPQPEKIIPFKFCWFAEGKEDKESRIERGADHELALQQGDRGA